MNPVTDADIAEVATMNNLTEACAMVEKIAGLRDGAMVVQRIGEVQLDWHLFMALADREHALRHWLTVERLFPSLIRKEISQVPG